MHILLIEDSAVETTLLMEALRDSPLPARLSVIGSSDSVLPYLRRQGDYQRVVRPHLILWSLPQTTPNVSSLLSELSADPALCVIPIILLGNPRSGIASAQLGAGNNVRVVPKPIGLHDYVTLVSEVTAWYQSAALAKPAHLFFEREPSRELLAGRGAVWFSRELRGLRNRAKERASIS